jgi:hypothetical protein
MKNWRELLYDRWDSHKSQHISTFIASNTDLGNKGKKANSCFKEVRTMNSCFISILVVQNTKKQTVALQVKN